MCSMASLQRRVPAILVASLATIALAAGCSDNTAPTPKAFVNATLGPGAQAPPTGCNFASTTPMISIGDVPDDGGPTTSVQDGDSQNGDPVHITCSVTPAANNTFSINLSAVLSGQGSLTIAGTVDPANPQPTINAQFEKGDTGSFDESDCTINFAMVPVSPAVAAGRIWGFITCPKASFASQNKICEGDAEFRFENCTGTPTN
jgi:hypothetical protein